MFFSRYCRSILFTTALVQDRYVKGQRAGADISLVDLEDSVSPRYKEDARRMAAEFFALPKESGSQLAIRINNLCDHDGLADLLAIRAYDHKPDIIVIPKVESARDIEIAENVLGESCPRAEFIAIVETARGIEQVSVIAAASPRLKALIFGSADLSFSINSTMDWEAMHYARGRVVMAARAAGIHAVDTPAFDVYDTDRLAEEATRARNMGFSGKVAIHPRQVSIINSIFSPDQAMLEKARKIVAQAEATRGNICVVDGMMVGTPIIESARRTLEEFGAAK